MRAKALQRISSLEGLSISMVAPPVPRGREAIHSTVEESLRLDLAELAVRHGLPPHVAGSGAFNWSRGGRRFASVGYKWTPDAMRLCLSFAVGGEPVRQDIRLTVTRPRCGGERRWFICPASGLTVRALFLPPGGRAFASRRAWGLVYQSTHDSGLERAVLRLLARHTGLPEPVHWRALERAPADVLGLRAERRWEEREQARERRNAIRRIRRAELRGKAGRADTKTKSGAETG